MSNIDFIKNASTSQTNSAAEKLEKNCLIQHFPTLTFRQYLINGYRFYLQWLAMTLGLSKEQRESLNFGIARGINSLNKIQSNMGIDLEVKHVLRNFETLYGKENMGLYKTSLLNQFKENMRVAEQDGIEYLDKYFKGALNSNQTLSEAEFFQRLSKIPTTVLDQHSSQTWRKPTVSDDLHVISINDITNGETFVVPSSRHLGLQMLAFYGYLDCFPGVCDNIEPKKVKKSNITFFV